ncbi:MAG: four helix bundle protein [Kofleriaceae bacterium]|nr:four helix bundle protein [Kofleriaceae bacterium]
MSRARPRPRSGPQPRWAAGRYGRHARRRKARRLALRDRTPSHSCCDRSPPSPRGDAALVDQWRRAALSVPLNIAEAVGKTSEADRHNRYAIARGEAMECGAIIDVIRLLDAISDPDLAEAKLLLVRIVAC